MFLNKFIEINNEKIQAEVFYSKIATIPALDTLVCNNLHLFSFPKVFTKLNHLKKITLNTDNGFSKAMLDKISFPLEMSKFKNTVLESNTPYIFKNLRYYFEHFEESTLTAEKKELAFAMLNNALGE